MRHRIRWILGGLVVGGGLLFAAGASASMSRSMRDLYPKVYNEDGTVTCTEWCGLFEPCC